MSAKRRTLGRGLDALLDSVADARIPETRIPEMQVPETPPQATTPTGTSVPIDLIDPNPEQPRTHFDETELTSLSNSIRERGLVQPIVVVPREGRFHIIAGERRWRAARLAGLTEVPVVSRGETSQQELLELALIENLQRADLNPVDEAAAYAGLRDRYQRTQEQIAQSVGKSRAAIANALRLLELPDVVQGWLRDGALSAGQARPMLALGDEGKIIELATRARDEGLSARQIEALVRSQTRKRRPTKAKEAHAQAAEERLTRALQTKVEIQRRGKGGFIKLHFHSEEELMRLFDFLNR